MLVRAAVAGVAVVGALGLMATPAQAAGTVKLVKVVYDSPGSDTGSNGSLNDEYVVLKNTKTESVQLEGWTLRDESRHVYTFPRVKLGAGNKLKVHTGRGSNSSSHVFWDYGWYVWNNTSDTAELRKPSGTLKDSCRWTSTGSGYTAC